MHQIRFNLLKTRDIVNNPQRSTKKNINSLASKTPRVVWVSSESDLVGTGRENGNANFGSEGRHAQIVIRLLTNTEC